MIKYIVLIARNVCVRVQLSYVEIDILDITAKVLRIVPNFFNIHIRQCTTKTNNQASTRTTKINSLVSLYFNERNMRCNR